MLVKNEEKDEEDPHLTVLAEQISTAKKKN